MSQTTSILLICPACKSRRQVPRSLIGQKVRCRQCTAELTVERPASDDDDDLLLADEPVPAGAINFPAKAAAADLSSSAAISVDDIPLPSFDKPARVEPPIALPPKAPPADYYVGPPPVPSKAVKDVLLRPPPPSALPSESWVKPPEKKTLTWAFTSGIYFYFLRPSALAQWVVLSSLLLISSWLLMMSARFLFAGFMALAGGCFALGGFAFAFAAASYGSACFVAIIENTAYHLDKADRWPEFDYVEWLFHFLRLLYLVALTSLFAGLFVALTAPIHQSLAPPVAIISYWIFFPILLLSVLETNSPFWAVSPPILRSLMDDWRAWLAFYAASALLAAAWYFALLFVAKQQSFLSLLLSSPLTAAAWFSYARLVGRLASYIMHLEEKEKTQTSKPLR
jgi:hypothetical protein